MRHAEREERLHHDLSALDRDYRIEHFGTRCGGLRIVVADSFEDGEFDGEFADRATALTDAAESASEHTCEACDLPVASACAATAPGPGCSPRATTAARFRPSPRRRRMGRSRACTFTAQRVAGLGKYR